MAKDPDPPKTVPGGKGHGPMAKDPDDPPKTVPGGKGHGPEFIVPPKGKKEKLEDELKDTKKGD